MTAPNTPMLNKTVVSTKVLDFKIEDLTEEDIPEEESRSNCSEDIFQQNHLIEHQTKKFFDASK